MSEWTSEPFYRTVDRTIVGIGQTVKALRGWPDPNPDDRALFMPGLFLMREETIGREHSLLASMDRTTRGGGIGFRCAREVGR